MDAGVKGSNIAGETMSLCNRRVPNHECRISKVETRKDRLSFEIPRFDIRKRRLQNPLQKPVGTEPDPPVPRNPLMIRAGGTTSVSSAWVLQEPLLTARTCPRLRRRHRSLDRITGWTG